MDLRAGAHVGPFIISEVTRDAVLCGNEDKHLHFESVFRVHHDTDETVGTLSTTASSKDLIGAVYLTLIWPGHKVLMSSILTTGVSSR